MYEEHKKSDIEILDEKYEDRGWGKYDITAKAMSWEDFYEKPLPLSQDEYHKFALLLGKLCVEDQNPELCDVYFELRDRATRGNHYSPVTGGEIDAMEEAMFAIGSNMDLRKNNSNTDSNYKTESNGKGK